MERWVRLASMLRSGLRPAGSGPSRLKFCSPGFRRDHCLSLAPGPLLLGGDSVPRASALAFACPLPHHLLLPCGFMMRGEGGDGV